MRLRRWSIIILTLLTAGAGRSLADIGPVRDFARYQDGIYGDPPQQTFRSSDVVAPTLNYDTWNKDLLTSAQDGSSHIFLTLGYEASGPYVFSDEDLSLVYADPSFEYTMNANVQSINGTDYLSFWHGARARSDSQGFCVFYDQNYRLVYNITTGPSFDGEADMHECEVTPDGNVLVTAYLDKPANLQPLHGDVDGLMADGCFQEIVPGTGEVNFEWCASEWFDVGLGYWNILGPFDTRLSQRDGSAKSNGFDVYHINSVQKTREGNYLVSLRNLKLITYIDGRTGEPIWKLGGKQNDFLDVTPASTLAALPESGGALSFGWQHHVRFVDDSLSQITLFDNVRLTNAIDCKGAACSRGRVLRIDTSDARWPTVEMMNDYRSPHGLSSVVFGSMQALVNPQSLNASSFLVGWGVSPEFTEHTADGTLIRNVQYSRLDPEHSRAGTSSVSSYRIFKKSWHGYPTWPPAIAVDESGALYVSWNGATEVRSWAVYGGYSSQALEPENGTWNDDPLVVKAPLLTTVLRMGFETKIELGKCSAAFIKVVALDSRGDVLGSTRTIETGWTQSFSSCLQDSMSFTCLIRLLA